MHSVMVNEPSYGNPNPILRTLNALDCPPFMEYPLVVEGTSPNRE